MKKIVRYSIPNIFTAASLLLGFSAIITSHYGSIEQAAWMIVWCGILDVMDGLAARLLKATSPFGAEFDSMADLVSFGVAPAIVMMYAVMQIASIEKYSSEFWALSISVSAFVLASTKALTEIDNAQNSLEYFSMLAICITAYIITIAGATPNETRSAIESNSAPNGEVAFSNLAASPSITSKIPHQTIIQAACSILP